MSSVIQWPVVPKPQPKPPKSLRLIENDTDLRESISCLELVLKIRQIFDTLKHTHGQTVSARQALCREIEREQT